MDFLLGIASFDTELTQKKSLSNISFEPTLSQDIAFP